MRVQVGDPPSESAVPGVLAVCLGMLSLTSADAFAKSLGQVYSPVQILFIRSLIALPVVALLAAVLGGPGAFRTRRLGLHLIRSVAAVGAAATFFLGITLLPLAEATAIAFAAPLFVTALSAVFLRERVGVRRWTATIVGFTGVLIIVQPGTAVFQPAALLLIGTALCYAIVMIIGRWIGRTETIWSMVFYLTLLSLIISGVAAVWQWEPPRLADWPLFLGQALFGTLGLALITQGFRIAPASVVAPFDYSGLIWATFFGWIFWSELPSLWVYLGAAVIAGSCLYIAWRET